MKAFVAIMNALLCATAAQGLTIPTVPIGNAGNPADTRYVDAYHPNGVGSVGYQFHMGKTEITNAQYVGFLNAVAKSDPYGLYSFSMGNSTWEGGIVRSGSTGSFSYVVKPAALNGTYKYDQKPVLFVNWGDAARFANWLHNGQPSGSEDSTTTEDGAYSLNGAITNAALNSVTRNPGARWWLPSDDEWYKSAYYDPVGIYYSYPIGTNTKPNNNLPANDTGSSANFYDNGYTTGNSNFPLTDAGAYARSGSPYHTFDQGGNVSEWNDTLFSSYRGVRGGYWGYDGLDGLHAAQWYVGEPAYEYTGTGFRVASIPEPATSVMLLTAAMISRVLSRRKSVPHNRV